MTCFSTLCCVVFVLQDAGDGLDVLSSAICFLRFELGRVLLNNLFWNCIFVLINGEIIVLSCISVIFALEYGFVSEYSSLSLFVVLIEGVFWLCLRSWLLLWDSMAAISIHMGHLWVEFVSCLLHLWWFGSDDVEFCSIMFFIGVVFVLAAQNLHRLLVHFFCEVLNIVLEMISAAMVAGFLILILIPLPFCGRILLAVNQGCISPLMSSNICRNFARKSLLSLLKRHRFAIFVAFVRSALNLILFNKMLHLLVAVLKLMHLAHWECVSFIWFGVSVFPEQLYDSLCLIKHVGPLQIFTGVSPSLVSFARSSFSCSTIFLHSLVFGILNLLLRLSSLSVIISPIILWSIMFFPLTTENAQTSVGGGSCSLHDSWG